ncbi:MAG: hypothetical protein GWO16_08025 [Gammaproteobacteria bacterium]|nr:hypothetical protein [Gammaproteobacteria bacterium]NIR97889.1 hypothetical protein [Gammaproteobacteria bacterium]NIT63594.1 hypothetical protein [Gammaproteobacteria bacterium]NIV20530.1 hypothetical protein [Gammaproteobacteria bacterium]NIX11124.1 hypothetical protein [Gammaproteobacteria bacterium]
MKRTACAVALVALTTAGAHAATKKDAGEMIQRALTARQQADELGFAWLHTHEKLIQPAKKAHRKGDYDRAAALAERALRQAELGKAQYNRAQKPGPRF